MLVYTRGLFRSNPKMYGTVCALIFAWFNIRSTVFADWTPSANVYTCEYLDQALVQWQNMAIYEFRNA
jgi:hypothetical protein